MTFHHSSKGSLRTAALAVLLPALGMPLTSHAVIDVGNTLMSVRTETLTEVTSGDIAGSSSARTTTTAIFDKHEGIVDQQTGLQWIRATTLAEGQALGYRAATADEFKGLVTHAGWGAINEPNVYSLTSGFSYQTGNSYSSSAGTSSSTNYSTNVEPIAFKHDVNLGYSNYPLDWAYSTASVGWLDGGETGLVGGFFDYATGNTGLGACSGNRNPVCSYHFDYTHDAVVAKFSDLAAGTYDSTAHSTHDHWSALVNQLPQTENGTPVPYFMVAVAAVPEPATWGLMGMGLMAVAAGARRRSKA